MESTFLLLDSIQAEVYALTAELLSPSALPDPVSRAKLLRSISRLLVSFNDYIALQEQSTPNDLRITLYRGKHRALLARVRQVQVAGLALRANAEQLAKRMKYEKLVEDGPQEPDAPAKPAVHTLEPENTKVLSHNKRITALLQATRSMLHTSVLQSELNIDSLSQQTQDLHKLHDDYGQFNDLLLKSKQIVKFIEKQDRSDKRRIYISGLFFTLCCAWVVWRRILRRPVLILVWSLLKTMRIFNWIFRPSSSVAKTATAALSLVSTLAPLTLSSHSSTEIISHAATNTFSVDIQLSAVDSGLAISASSHFNVSSISSSVADSSISMGSITSSFSVIMSSGAPSAMKHDLGLDAKTSSHPATSVKFSTSLVSPLANSTIVLASAPRPATSSSTCLESVGTLISKSVETLMSSSTEISRSASIETLRSSSLEKPLLVPAEISQMASSLTLCITIANEPVRMDAESSSSFSEITSVSTLLASSSYPPTSISTSLASSKIPSSSISTALASSSSPSASNSASPSSSFSSSLSSYTTQPSSSVSSTLSNVANSSDKDLTFSYSDASSHSSVALNSSSISVPESKVSHSDSLLNVLLSTSSSNTALKLVTDLSQMTPSLNHASSHNNQSHVGDDQTTSSGPKTMVMDSQVSFSHTSLTSRQTQSSHSTSLASSQANSPELLISKTIVDATTQSANLTQSIPGQNLKSESLVSNSRLEHDEL